MAKLSKKEFMELADNVGSRCISIFLPTHRAGQEVLNHQDEILFKNLLREVEEALEERGFAGRENQAFLEPAWRLLDDRGFWRHQSDGLAVFLGRDFFRYYTLPYGFEPRWHVAQEFYLKPLLPLMVENHEFFLLTLDLKNVDFYKGDKNGLEKVHLQGILPQQLEEVVGFDYEQRFLGFHSQAQGGNQAAIFHGHGKWQEDEKDEILTYFRAINEAITDYIQPETSPLVVACLDYLFPIYKEANTYDRLFPEHVAGNPEVSSADELHEAALGLLSAKFRTPRTESEELFRELYNKADERGATDIKDIIPAALGGRVDTLFLARDYEAWGYYDKQNASVRLHDQQTPSSVSLTNLAAMTVFRNGGRVYLDERGKLPFTDSGVNALYRY